MVNVIDLQIWILPFDELVEGFTSIVNRRVHKEVEHRFNSASDSIDVPGRGTPLGQALRTHHRYRRGLRSYRNARSRSHAGPCFDSPPQGIQLLLVNPSSVAIISAQIPDELRMKVRRKCSCAIYRSVIGGVREGRGIGHHLYPTRNAQIVHPAHDVRRCEIDGGDSRTTKTVQCVASFRAPSSIQRRHAANASPLITLPGSYSQPPHRRFGPCSVGSARRSLQTPSRVSDRSEGQRSTTCFANSPGVRAASIMCISHCFLLSTTLSFITLFFNCFSLTASF